MSDFQGTVKQLPSGLRGSLRPSQTRARPAPASARDVRCAGPLKAADALEEPLDLLVRQREGRVAAELVANLRGRHRVLEPPARAQQPPPEGPFVAGSP